MTDCIAIRIESLTKEFVIYGNRSKKLFGSRKLEKRTVLDGIDLDVKKGEILGILGDNGSGKSTLLKIVAGIMSPTEGKVIVNGKVASILELNMGFHDDLTGLENIYVRGQMYGIPKKVITERLDDIIAYADIGDYIYSPVRMLSSGMRSRLAFAIMINVDADIYIIDEALSIGDSKFNIKAGGYFRNLVRQGKTVVITAHNTYNIKSMCTRAVLLENGKIAFDGNPEEACAYHEAMDLSTEENVRVFADSGIPKAQYRLSKIVRTKDIEGSRKLLKEAATAGHPLAMSEYGNILMEEGMTAEAIEFYRMASEMNEDSSKWKFAVSESSFEEDELMDTMKWMADNGDHFDKLRYGQLLYLTSRSEKDYKNAFSVLKGSSDEGNLDARYQVAKMMLTGTGTDVNVEEGMRLLLSLGDTGHISAMVRLSQIYHEGTFVPIDMAQVFRWNLALANTGMAEYQFAVAMMYTKGLGVEANQDEAKNWFGKYVIASISQPVNGAAHSSKYFGFQPKLDAFNMNNILIKGNNRKALSDNLRVMTDVHKVKNPEKVFALAQQAASSYGYFQSFLADCYYRGIGTDVDLDKAFALYRNAADSGNPNAMVMLGLMYRDGVGTEKDMGMSQKYIRMAAKRDDPVATSIVEGWNEKISKRIKKIPNVKRFGKNPTTRGKP